MGDALYNIQANPFGAAVAAIAVLFGLLGLFRQGDWQRRKLEFQVEFNLSQADLDTLFQPAFDPFRRTMTALSFASGSVTGVAFLCDIAMGGASSLHRAAVTVAGLAVSLACIAMGAVFTFREDMMNRFVKLNDFDYFRPFSKRALLSTDPTSRRPVHNALFRFRSFGMLAFGVYLACGVLHAWLPFLPDVPIPPFFR